MRVGRRGGASNSFFFRRALIERCGIVPLTGCRGGGFLELSFFSSYFLFVRFVMDVALRSETGGCFARQGAVPREC